MAHWAQIGPDDRVLQITVGNDNDPDEGYQWLVDNIGGEWVKTSYNTHQGVHLLGGTPLRKNYATINGHYDRDRDAFYPERIYKSWTLNEETCMWEPPIPYPTDGNRYKWDEVNLVWVKVATGY